LTLKAYGSYDVDKHRSLPMPCIHRYSSERYPAVTEWSTVTKWSTVHWKSRDFSRDFQWTVLHSMTAGYHSSGTLELTFTSSQYVEVHTATYSKYVVEQGVIYIPLLDYLWAYHCNLGKKYKKLFIKIIENCLYSYVYYCHYHILF
jgi:hypothetical protein